MWSGGTTRFPVSLSQLAAAVLLAAALFAPVVSAAQDAAPAPKKVKPAAKAAATARVQMPDGSQLLLLIRTTLLALSDATQTGNFTVLRDLGAPGFRDANPANRLSQTFAGIGAQGVDLSAVAVIAPKLTGTPTIDPKTQMLRIKGFFPGEPVQINFELLYQPVGGRWRVFGMAVNPGPSSAAAAAAAKVPDVAPVAEAAPAQ